MVYKVQKEIEVIKVPKGLQVMMENKDCKGHKGILVLLVLKAVVVQLVDKVHAVLLGHLVKMVLKENVVMMALDCIIKILK